MNSPLLWFIIGFLFAHIGLQLIDLIKNLINDCMLYFSSLFTVKITKHNVQIAKDSSKAELFDSETQEIIYGDDNGGEDNYL